MTLSPLGLPRKSCLEQPSWRLERPGPPRARRTSNSYLSPAGSDKRSCSALAGWPPAGPRGAGMGIPLCPKEPVDYPGFISATFAYLGLQGERDLRTLSLS